MVEGSLPPLAGCMVGGEVVGAPVRRCRVGFADAAGQCLVFLWHWADRGLCEVFRVERRCFLRAVELSGRRKFFSVYFCCGENCELGRVSFRVALCSNLNQFCI